jgi:hypothetical protein
MRKLKINPLVKPKHYQYYFSLNQRSASRYYNKDLNYLIDIKNIRLYTFQEFYELYNAFPDPKFIPIYIN